MGPECWTGHDPVYGNISFPAREPKGPEEREPRTLGAQLEERHGESADITGVALSSGHSACGSAVSGCPGLEKWGKGRQEEGGTNPPALGAPSLEL